MMEVLDSADDLVAIRVSGKVEKEEWETVTSAVSAALSRHEHISMFMNLADLDAISAGAIVEDMKFALKSLGSLDQFKKAAVVADAGWLERLTQLSGKLLPEMETQVFSTGEEQEALRWAAA